MTLLETLVQEANDAPEWLISETLDFLRFLKFRQATDAPRTAWGEAEMRAYAACSLQYASQLYGDEEDLLPVDGTETTHAAAG